jgi:hypothetical protein
MTERSARQSPRFAFSIFQNPRKTKNRKTQKFVRKKNGAKKISGSQSDTSGWITV